MPDEFQVILSNRAQSDLKSLPPNIRLRIMRRMKQLETEPFPRGRAIRRIAGMEGILRFRIGDYRVIYQITGRQVEVLRVIHRRDLEKALSTLKSV